MFSHKNYDQEKLNLLKSIKGDIELKSHLSTSDKVIIEALGSYASTLTELVTEEGDEFRGDHKSFIINQKINDPQVANDQEKLNLLKLLKSIKGDIESKSHLSTSDKVIIDALDSYASTLTEIKFRRKKIANSSHIPSIKKSEFL